MWKLSHFHSPIVLCINMFQFHLYVLLHSSMQLVNFYLIRNVITFILVFCKSWIRFINFLCWTLITFVLHPSSINSHLWSGRHSKYLFFQKPILLMILPLTSVHTSPREHHLFQFLTFCRQRNTKFPITETMFSRYLSPCSPLGDISIGFFMLSNIILACYVFRLLKCHDGRSFLPQNLLWYAIIFNWRIVSI